MLHFFAKVMDKIVSVEAVRDLVVRKKLTHKQISEELRRANPGVRGLSEMSVRRFCSAHDIHRMSKVTDQMNIICLENCNEKL